MALLVSYPPDIKHQEDVLGSHTKNRSSPLRLKASRGMYGAVFSMGAPSEQSESRGRIYFPAKD